MAAGDFEVLQWSFDEERGVGEIALDRPDRLNALSSQLRAEIDEAFDAFEALERDAGGVAVRAVVIRGEGEKAFSAGADIKEFGDRPSPGDLELPQGYGRPATFAGPVIAEVDGYCLGGGFEVALSCDFRIASERSTFGLPEVDLGLIPAGGGTQRLAAALPPSTAKELLMLGTHLSAAEALELDLVDYVHPHDELRSAVHEFADRLASKAPLSVRAVKETVDTAHELGLQEGLLYERRVANLLKETEDHEEGRAAFGEKRDPVWQGR